jgi:lysophospholipase L1-like esterase
MRPRGWREAALVVAGLVVAGAAAEGVARLLWQEPSPKQRPLPPEWRELPTLAGLFEMARANVRGLVGGALYETNSAGFRGAERALRKPRGVFRIAVIGDSFAMGSGVTQQETYADRLERTLAVAHPERRFQVLNFGLAGLAAPAVVDRLVQLGLRYDPDLIVYGYTLNDIEGPAYRRSVEASFVDPTRFLHSPLRVWRLLGPRFASLRELLLAPRGSYSFEIDDNYFHNPEAWGSVLEALDRLAAISRKRGTCGLVLVHTQLYWLNALHPYRPHYRLVSEAARQRGLHVIESFPAFRGESAASLWVGPIDSHPNARAHEILFETLNEGLERLPASCWEGRRRGRKEAGS